MISPRHGEDSFRRGDASLKSTHCWQLRLGLSSITDAAFSAGMSETEGSVKLRTTIPALFGSIVGWRAVNAFRVDAKRRVVSASLAWWACVAAAAAVAAAETEAGADAEAVAAAAAAAFVTWVSRRAV